jgi:hypothetical protein
MIELFEESRRQGETIILMCGDPGMSRLVLVWEDSEDYERACKEVIRIRDRLLAGN